MHFTTIFKTVPRSGTALMTYKQRGSKVEEKVGNTRCIRSSEVL